jgi:two-component system sensor histidine kinase KdpD
MKNTVAAYVGSAQSVAVAALVAAAISKAVSRPHVSVLMLLAVFYSAVRWGRGPSLLAAACSVAVSSFFFMPPTYSFYVSAPQDVIDLVVFFIAAVVTSHLASRVKLQAAEAARREMTMLQLSSFSRSLAGMLDADGVLRATAAHCTVTFQRRTALLIPKNAALIQIGPRAGTSPLSYAAMGDAQRLWNGRDTAIAAGTSGAAINGWEFRGLRVDDASIGLLAIETAAAAITPEDERTIDSVTAPDRSHRRSRGRNRAATNLRQAVQFLIAGPLQLGPVRTAPPDSPRPPAAAPAACSSRTGPSRRRVPSAVCRR